MSSPVSSAALPSASSSSCATADFTRFPTQDVSCAVGSTQGIPSNTSDAFKSCCKSAPVEQFNGPCGFYCLSVDQSVASLQECLQKAGVNPGSIFCNSNNTATATAKPSSSARQTSSGTGNTPGSSTTSSAGSSSSMGAASSLVMAPQGISKAGVGMLAMLFVSALAGTIL